MNRVLLVDDEIFARQGLRNLIDWASCGFEVIGEAGNGEDALASFEELRPDLVITDIRMPVMDGLELIRRATEEMAEPPSFIIISGYNDFKYAQQAVRFGVVDFILKPIDEDVLETTLRQLNEKIAQERSLRRERERLMKERIVNALITGEAGAEQSDEWSSRLGLPVNVPVRYTFIELNDNHPWLADAGIVTQEQFRQAIRETLEQRLDGSRDVHLHEHRSRVGVILSSDEIASAFGSLEQYAIRLQQAIEERVQRAVYVYVGSEVSSLSKLRQAYLTAKETLQHKYGSKDKHYVLYDTVKDLALHELDADKQFHRELTERIEENDEEGIRHLIERLFREFEEQRYAPEAVKMVIHHCVTDVITVAKQMDIERQQLKNLEPIISWQDMNLSLEELKRLFTAFVASSAKQLSKGRKESMRGSISKIKNYIETNYSDNISLKSLSNEFYMNPVYLGQLFKKTYGVYFNDFLLQLRVDEAKKLLRQTDLRIYEIAERVGFTSSDYFVTQFEKIEHMTPTEYRNKLK